MAGDFALRQRLQAVGACFTGPSGDKDDCVDSTIRGPPATAFAGRPAQSVSLPAAARVLLRLRRYASRATYRYRSRRDSR